VDDERQGAERPAAGRTWSTRLLAGLLAVGIAALLAWWSDATARGVIGDVHLLDRPAGTPVVLSLQPVTAILDDGHYAVGRRSLRVVVQGDPRGLQVGSDVTVQGTVGDGMVIEGARRSAPGRPAKRQLGFVGLGLAAIGFFATTRLTRHGWRVTWPTS
jgi:hypothetical protein